MRFWVISTCVHAGIRLHSPGIFLLLQILCASQCSLIFPAVRFLVLGLPASPHLLVCACSATGTGMLPPFHSTTRLPFTVSVCGITYRSHRFVGYAGMPSPLFVPFTLPWVLRAVWVPRILPAGGSAITGVQAPPARVLGCHRAITTWAPHHLPCLELPGGLRHLPAYHQILFGVLPFCCVTCFPATRGGSACLPFLELTYLGWVPRCTVRLPFFWSTRFFVLQWAPPGRAYRAGRKSRCNTPGTAATAGGFSFLLPPFCRPLEFWVPAAPASVAAAAPPTYLPFRSPLGPAPAGSLPPPATAVTTVTCHLPGFCSAWMPLYLPSPVLRCAYCRWEYHDYLHHFPAPQIPRLPPPPWCSAHGYHLVP